MIIKITGTEIIVEAEPWESETELDLLGDEWEEEECLTQDESKVRVTRGPTSS